MASHFSSVGMPVKSQADMRDLIVSALETAEQVSCPGGGYLHWRCDEGAELWIQVEGEDVVGVTPCFGLAGRMNVAITGPVQRPDDTPLEGAFHAWADPQGKRGDDGAYPFVFDMADRAVFGDPGFPFFGTLRLGAFALEITLYESEDAYTAAQEGEVKFAAESFIPAGLFTPKGEATEPPQSVGILTGRILDAARLVNPLTGGAFHWMHVKTLGGEMDVVCDPALIGTAPVVGGIASGTFWLCGRMLQTG